jgi:hypothetical protein
MKQECASSVARPSVHHGERAAGRSIAGQRDGSASLDGALPLGSRADPE